MPVKHSPKKVGKDAVKTNKTSDNAQVCKDNDKEMPPLEGMEGVEGPYVPQSSRKRGAPPSLDQPHTVNKKLAKNISSPPKSTQEDIADYLQLPPGGGAASMGSEPQFNGNNVRNHQGGDDINADNVVFVKVTNMADVDHDELIKVIIAKSGEIRSYSKAGVYTKIKCLSATQMHKLLNVNKIGDFMVEVSEPRQSNQNTTLNKQIIFNVPLKRTIEEITSATHATSAWRMTRRVEGVATPTTTIVLTYDKDIAVPDVVYINYLTYRPRQYVNRPLRCFKCMNYGHTQKYCRKTENTCPICGGKHPYEECPNPKGPRTCANCKGAHSAAFTGCPMYIKSQEITKISQTDKISYRDAVMKLKTLPQGGGNTGTNTQTGPPTLPTLHNNVAPPLPPRTRTVATNTTHEIGCQTDHNNIDADKDVTNFQIAESIEKLYILYKTMRQGREYDLDRIIDTLTDLLSLSAQRRNEVLDTYDTHFQTGGPDVHPLAYQGVEDVTDPNYILQYKDKQAYPIKDVAQCVIGISNVANMYLHDQTISPIRMYVEEFSRLIQLTSDEQTLVKKLVIDAIRAETSINNSNTSINESINNAETNPKPS